MSFSKVVISDVYFIAGMSKYRCILFSFIVTVFWINSILLPLRADEQSKSLAFKNQYIQNSPFIIKRYDYTANLVDAFMVVQKANAGEPMAQHDLGLRYLTGTDFVADTVKACYWIRKAAEQNLIPARYNYGIMLNNGWGVAWNPFEAFKHFHYAALHDMIEAKYVYGILLTDNLVAPRNYAESYLWIKAAADSGYAPAKEVLKEFVRRGIISHINAEQQNSTQNSQPVQSSNPANVVPGLKPIFLDFSTDSVAEPDNATLVKDVWINRNEHSKKESDSIEIPPLDSLNNYKTILSLYDAAEAGSPEALTLLGRCHEKGINVKKDVLMASVYYLRASRFDSPWSPRLLWKMVHNNNLSDRLKNEVDAGNPSAEYIWACLVALDLDNQITEPQALQLLEDAAKKNYLPAIVELGMCLYTGRWVKQDEKKAIEILQHAREMGSREADLQLCAIELRDENNPENAKELVRTLQQFASDGSVLAESVLGYCYQIGKGVGKNTTESVRLYRKAAARGSQVAYKALRQLYDNMRPGSPEFNMHDN